MTIECKNIKPLGRGSFSHHTPIDIDKFFFGAPYYPEHWDKETRKNDAKRMAEAGFNIVRMAEFAWDRMETEEGKYDFSLFDEVIEEMAEKGLQTMLCTPTATPPRWLTKRYHEILRVDDSAVKMEHGSRQHACHGNPVFRDYSRRITSAMAVHYKDNPHVVGWQTDNEFHCHFSECHCDSCQAVFADFLREKYDTYFAISCC